jgi:uncharacterized protein YidB (DUF937 family)
MGLFDGLSGMLENAISSHVGGLSGLMGEALSNFGGLDGILAKLNDAGLGQQVNSWLGRGENMPLTADQIGSVLGSAQLQELAVKFGVSMDQVPQLLATHLPTAVDQASPDGVLVNPN